jgi:tetratricopeptide (TPR) repeat protein
MLHATFTKCERFNWTGAIEGIEELSEALSFPGLHPPDELLRFTIYLKGTIHQSLGDLDVALNCYNNPLLALANPAITSRNSYTSSAHEMLAILAALNSCLITHAPSHSQHQSIESICEHLSNCFDNIKNDSSGAQTLATSNPNLAAAWGIIHAIRTAPTTLPRSSHEQATAPSPSTQHNKGILLTKSHLQRSIHLARSVENKHLMAVLMTLISSFFFTGQIGEHAYGAANGARATAKTAGLRVWQMLAADMAAQRLEGDGKKEEADRMWREVEGLERILPGGLFERDGAL